MNSEWWVTIGRALMLVSFAWDVLALVAVRAGWVTGERIQLSITSIGAAQYLLWLGLAALLARPLRSLLRGQYVERLALAAAALCVFEFALTLLNVTASPSVQLVLAVRLLATLSLAAIAAVRTQQLGSSPPAAPTAAPADVRPQQLGSSLPAAQTAAPADVRPQQLGSPLPAAPTGAPANVRTQQLGSPLPAAQTATAAQQPATPSVFDLVLRRWFHWRSSARPDWLFIFFMAAATALLLVEVRRHHQLEQGYRELTGCLTRADVSGTNTAIERLARLDPPGLRWTIAQARGRLVTAGWSKALELELISLEKQTAPNSPEHLDAAIALGDVQAAQQHTAEARQRWASLRGLGEDALIDARLAALDERTQTAEREAAQKRRDEEDQKRAADSARDAALREGLNQLMMRISADFELAISDARQGRLDVLTVRLRLFESITGASPAEVMVHFNAAREALSSAASAQQRLSALTDETLPRVQTAAALSAERLRRDELIAIGRSQLQDGLRILRGLPIEVVAPPTLKVYQLSP